MPARPVSIFWSLAYNEPAIPTLIENKLDSSHKVDKAPDDAAEDDCTSGVGAQFVNLRWELVACVARNTITASLLCR